MKKKYIALSLAAIILTSQLTGCASVPSNVMLEMLNSGQDIEITLSVPDYEISSQGELQALTDTQLDQLQTYTDGGFRGDFDTLFGIKPLVLSSSNTKSGCIYVSSQGTQEGNTSFMDSLRNKVFMEQYLNKAEVQESLSKLAERAYTDVDPDNTEAYLASLNAYYNLLNDGTKGVDEYFNATQSLSRGDFYSFVYRGTTPVNTLLKTQGDFKSKVNTNATNALYASQVDQHAWLNADNEGLRAGNYDQSISRAEAIYMLVNMYFSDELKAIDPQSIKLDDAKDGGTFLEDQIPSKKESDQLYSTDKKSKEQTMASGYQLGIISKMLKSQDNEVQTDIYKALGVAKEIGLIAPETRFNEPISKSESIELLINVAKALNTRDGYLTDTEYPGEYEYGEITIDEEGLATVEVDGKTGYVSPDSPLLNDNDNKDQQGTTDNGSTSPEKPVTPPASSKPATPEKPVTPPTSKPATPEKPVTPPTSKPSGGGNSGGGNNGNVWVPPADFVPIGGPLTGNEQGTYEDTINGSIGN